MLNQRYGPPQCPKCGVYEYNHDCPFTPCKKTAYDKYWQDLAKTFGISQRGEPDKCNCIKCRAKRYAELLKKEKNQ